MADAPSCPHCRQTTLFHTGALWMCPRCGLMITKHALAAERAGNGSWGRAGEELPASDGPAGPLAE